MRGPTRPPSLRREVVLWYSLVLLLALLVFSGASYIVLRQALSRTATASMQQTAIAAEQLIAPAYIPRVAVEEQRVPPQAGQVEAMRRRTQLATGEVLDIYVARSGDIEQRALRLFLIISVLLIPLTAGGAALGGRAIADRLLKPLDRLVGATREIGIGALSRPVVEPDRPAELRELAHAFNGMLSRLDRAVDALRNFTADASHELRTPLTAIKGTAQVALARERSAPELRETLGDIVEETEWMLHLVEGLLTLARGEQSGTPLARQPLDLVPLLEDVRELGASLAATKPIAVRLSAPAMLPLVGAAGPLRQVLVNLVSNAVRFTAAGEVEIRARTLPAAAGGREESEGWVEVEVADTGVGIPTAELPRVFDRFYRGDAARAREGGAGLGLAIARLIVERHGGRITLESEPGHGTTARVLLPRRAAVPSTQAGEEPES